MNINTEMFEDLQDAYSAALQEMFATPHRFRLQTEPQNDGSHHVEINGGEYNLVATERGLELERRKTDDREEILYWLISHMAFWEAVGYEVQNRVGEQDCRRIIFRKQSELLARVNPHWAERCEQEIREILADNPFIDGR